MVRCRSGLLDRLPCTKPFMKRLVKSRHTSPERAQPAYKPSGLGARLILSSVRTWQPDIAQLLTVIDSRIHASSPRQAQCQMGPRRRSLTNRPPDGHGFADRRRAHTPRTVARPRRSRRTTRGRPRRGLSRSRYGPQADAPTARTRLGVGIDVSPLRPTSSATTASRSW